MISLVLKVINLLKLIPELKGIMEKNMMFLVPEFVSS